MKIPSSIKAIIFDMDGVLLLSGRLHEEAYKKVLGNIGITKLDYSLIAGMRTDESFKLVLTMNQYKFTDKEITQLTAQKRSFAHELLKETPPIIPDCQLMLQSLSAKYRVTLASSASPQNIALFLKESNCSHFFEFVIDGSAVERAKPSPDIYLLCASKLGVSPGECLVIEDSSAGVRAGKTAGMLVYAVLGTEKAEKLKQNGAHTVMSNVIDILAYTTGS